MFRGVRANSIDGCSGLTANMARLMTTLRLSSDVNVWYVAVKEFEGGDVLRREAGWTVMRCFGGIVR